MPTLPVDRRAFLGSLCLLPFLRPAGRAQDEPRPKGAFRPSRTGQRYYVEGNFIADLRTFPLQPRSERGGQSAYFAMGNTTMEAHLSEIPPGESKRAHRHVNEAILAIVSGRGYSEIWTDEGGEKHRYDWKDGSLLTVPLNAYHQHFNADPQSPARYLAITNVPLMLMLFGTEDFVYANSFAFPKMWDDFFAAQRENVRGRNWKVQFVEDLRKFPLTQRDFRADASAKFLTGTRTIGAHISQIPPGKPKPAHRHINEACIYILSGQGYTRIYERAGGPEKRYDWKAGSLLSIPLNHYHQHVNTRSDQPALYLAVTNTPLMYAMIGSKLVHGEEGSERYES